MAEKKVTKRLNAIDYIIIIIAIGCIAGIFFRYDIVERLGRGVNQEKARVSFSAELLGKEESGAIHEGDGFRIASEDMVFGTLTEEPEIKTARTYSLDSDGRIIREEDNGKFTVTGTISASGKFTENGFLLGGTLYIAPGKTVKIHSNKAEFSVIITKINEEKAD